ASRACRDGRGARDARRRPRARERRRGDRGCPSVGGRRELGARAFARDQRSRARARVRGGGTVTTAGLYGNYGGRYVPETLIPALDELEAGWRAALEDEGYRAELERLGHTYAGRPTPLTRAERFAPESRL